MGVQRGGGRRVRSWEKRKRWGLDTAVVLNADRERDSTERGGNVGGVRGIDGHNLVRARVV